MQILFRGLIVIPGLLLLFSTANAQEKLADTQPKFIGDIRTWYITDLSKNQGSFLVRNARLFISGNVNEYVSYKTQFDFAAAGRLTTNSRTDTIGGKRFISDLSITSDYPNILAEAFVTITPLNKLSFSLGEMKVPFSTENLLSTAVLAFSNRALLSGRISPDVYDIGFMVSYSLPAVIPVDLYAAGFNGTGLNKSDNDKTTNFALRASVWPVQDLNISGNYAGGTYSGNKTGIFDLGIGYKFANLTLAAEYAQRITSPAGLEDIKASSYYAYATYDIPVSAGLLKFVTPAFRYESYDPSTSLDNNELKKYTAGLTFSFAKLTFAHLRINYEKYQDGIQLSANPDQMIFEFQIRF